MSLEEDLSRMARYVELDEGNFKTYSIELARLLLSAGSEVDVVAKQLCAKANPKTKASNIGHYRQVLRKAFPQIERMQLSMPRFGLTLKPWSNWEQNKKPQWWDAYNAVKHERHNNYADANLKNVLNAVSGLLVVTLFLYSGIAEQGRLSPNPSLFRPVQQFYGGTAVVETEILVIYALHG